MSMNFILLYLALFHTPKIIKTYTVLIINFAVADFSACLMNLFVEIRMLPGSRSLTYLLNGFCQFTGKTSCAIGVSILLHTLSHQVYCLLISFCYRYSILKTSKPLSRRSLWTIIAIFYIPSYLSAITYWTNFVDADEILSIAQKYYPKYNFSAEPGLLTGIVDLFTPSASYGIIHICLPVTPVYITMFILRRKIVQSLSKNARIMSKETKTIHSQLLKALTLQTIMPVFEWCGATNYFLMQLGILTDALFQYLSFALVIITPTLAPLTYLLFVRPYRNYLISHLLGIDVSQHFVANRETTISKINPSRNIYVFRNQ